MSLDLHILWVGYSDSGSGRFWGYFENTHDNSWLSEGSFNKYYYTFWGQKNGKVFFKSIRGDNTFRKNVREKQEKYTVLKNAEFNQRIIDEFGQYRLHRMLKYGYA
jgi:hypothetical protein